MAKRESLTKGDIRKKTCSCFMLLICVANCVCSRMYSCIALALCAPIMKSGSDKDEGNPKHELRLTQIHLFGSRWGRAQITETHSVF